ncbi:MAG: ATP-binding protein, partial [Sphingomicrobium sp.]
MRALRARPSVPMTVAASAGVLALLASSAILSTSGSAHVAILAVTVTLILLVSALIGERARMSAAAAGLRETNRMLRMGEELADFGYWRFVPDAGELECSMQARAIAGVAAGSLSFADAIALVLPADRHSLLRCLAKARAGVTVECRAQLRRADGQIRTVAVKAQCEPRGKSDPLGLFGVVCDISDKVAAEQKLIATRDAARVAAKAKGQFLATMSHEIRTPMTGVLGMIELLRGNPERADRARYLDAMQKSADLLMAILDDVLDFSKIESGKLHLDTRDFDFAALVRSTIDMYFNAAARKGLLLTLTADCAAAPVVRGDPVRLQQVLCNLISNAIKFTASGSVTVVVSSRAVAGGWQRWRVAVTDSGIGIRAVEQQRLFQPFSQADSARGHGGTGLGLSISRWLIEAMGGML